MKPLNIVNFNGWISTLRFVEKMKSVIIVSKRYFYFVSESCSVTSRLHSVPWFNKLAQVVSCNIELQGRFSLSLILSVSLNQ